MYLAVHHFRHLLEGNCFTLLMDHNPTVQAFAKISYPWSSRQSRMLQYISEFPVTVEFMSGGENEIADLFLRSVAAVLLPSSVSTPSMQEFITAQAKCKDLRDLACSTSLCIKNKSTKHGALSVDTSTGQESVLVPTKLRKQVFGALHNMAHPGIRGTKRLISQCYIWKGLAADVREFCNNCNNCQRSKVHKHLKPPPSAVPIPSRRFSEMNVDIVGPLPSLGGEGFKYILSMIDQNTRWFELAPLINITTESVCKALVSYWISRYGVRSTVYSDRGSQFTSEPVWGSLSGSNRQPQQCSIRQEMEWWSVSTVPSRPPSGPAPPQTGTKTCPGSPWDYAPT